LGVWAWTRSSFLVDVATQSFQLTVLEVGAMPVETFLSGGVRLS
jgi:hypothetical protein